MSPQKLPKYLWILSALAMAFVAYLIASVIANRMLAPPSGVSTFEEFAKQMPPALTFRLTRVENRDYLMWIGRVSSSWRLPSGPPVYVFNTSGKLVAWTPDVGNGSTFREWWAGSLEEPDLTLEEARHWLDSRGKRR